MGKNFFALYTMAIYLRKNMSYFTPVLIVFFLTSVYRLTRVPTSVKTRTVEL